MKSLRCRQWALVAVSLFFAATAFAQPPRLVLQITVDQLRGDLLPRFRESFGEGGFRLLMDRGVYFGNAHYETANTLTCAGHAVLVTGGDVGEHGIVGNNWYDRDAGRNVYCVDDARFPPVGEPAGEAAGMSPSLLTSTTVGDELVTASGRRSRAFAVAGKDRSSIVPGGHLGKAFWYSNATGGMASSKYYYEKLPGWVVQWNDRKLYTKYREKGWTLLRPLGTYTNAAKADNEHARPKGNVGTKFPHRLDTKGDAGLRDGIRYTPFLDELTADFARELISREKLGQGQAAGGKGFVTDYLSISFSSTDYVGHTFGPNSVEAEDNLLRLDATLARLLAFVDTTVGLRNTVVVLSADHGVDDIPEERRSAGHDAARFGGEVLQAKLNVALRKRFNVKVDLVAAVIPPGFYLNQPNVRAQGLNVREVEQALAEALREEPGIAYAFTRSDLMAGHIGHTPVLDSVQRAFHPKRSGDVVAVQKAFYYLDEAPDYYAATHGSPYTYDTFVPIIVLAPGVKAATSYEPVSPGQVAPTLSALLGITPPSGCSCAPPLPHVLPR